MCQIGLLAGNARVGGEEGFSNALLYFLLRCAVSIWLIYDCTLMGARISCGRNIAYLQRGNVICTQKDAVIGHQSCCGQHKEL